MMFNIWMWGHSETDLYWDLYSEACPISNGPSPKGCHVLISEPRCWKVVYSGPSPVISMSSWQQLCRDHVFWVKSTLAWKSCILERSSFASSEVDNMIDNILSSSPPGMNGAMDSTPLLFFMTRLMTSHSQTWTRRPRSCNHVGKFQLLEQQLGNFFLLSLHGGQEYSVCLFIKIYCLHANILYHNTLLIL